jgi:hypothetical protein
MCLLWLALSGVARVQVEGRKAGAARLQSKVRRTIRNVSYKLIERAAGLKSTVR